MKILFQLFNNGFDSLPEDEKKEEENSGEEMLYAIQYLKNSEKSRFSETFKSVMKMTLC